MHARIHVVVLALITIASPAIAQTRGTEIGAGGSFLLSLQPIDDFFVGGPYLNEGVGGLGPGMAFTFNVTTPHGLVVSAEFSTAWFAVEQSGRLVSGACQGPNPSNDCLSVGGAATTRLRDPLLGGLVGAARRRGATHAQFVGGVGWIMRGPTANGVEILRVRGEDPPGVRRYHRPVVLTGGFDVIHGLTPRTSFTAGARYVYVPRDRNLTQLGIGNHIIRFGAGLRFRLN